MRTTEWVLAVILGLVALSWRTLEMTPKSTSHSSDKIEIFNALSGKTESVDKVVKTEVEWKALLTPEQFYVTRQQGTERAFTGEYWNTKEEGIYRCVACGTHLFSSQTKFDSGTGWPSFWEPVSQDNLGHEEDFKFFTKRIEVHCRRCGAHLGHVFDDGPPPTHKRYCINSASLDFLKSSARDKKSK